MVFEQKQQMIVLFAFAAAFEVYGAGLMIKHDDSDDLLSVDYDTGYLKLYLWIPIARRVATTVIPTLSTEGRLVMVDNVHSSVFLFVKGCLFSGANPSADSYGIQTDINMATVEQGNCVPVGSAVFHVRFFWGRCK